MTPSSPSANSISTTRPPISALENRLRELVARTLGMHPDQLVGYLSDIDHLAGEPDVPPLRARAWLGSARTGGPRLGRVFRLDPYTLQVLIDDAQRAGRGTRLDVVVARSTPSFVIAAVRRRLASLARRGIDVRVRSERRRRQGSRLLAP